MSNVTQEMFNAWLLDPVTKEVIRILNAKREELRQAWEGGSFTDYAKDATALVNVGNLGTCKGDAYVTDLDWETFEGDSSDE